MPPVFPKERGLKPTPERLARGDVVKTLHHDHQNFRGERVGYRAKSSVERLYENGQIDSAAYDAGQQFHAAFVHGHLVGIKAFDPSKPLGPGGGVYGFNAERARSKVWNALQALGGLTSPAGTIAWQVIGEEMPLHLWAEQMQRGRETARTLLIDTCEILAEHYNGGRKRGSGSV